MFPETQAHLRRTLLATASVVILAGSAACTQASAATIQPLVTTATATRLGAGDRILNLLPAAQLIHVEVGLKLRNQTQLDQFLAHANDPKTPLGQRSMTPAQFAQRFSPTAAQVNRVVQYLRDQGFGGIEVAPNKLLVSATGSTTQVNTAFHTMMAQVQTAGGRTAYANAEAVQVPATLQDTVLSVLGLQNVHQYHTLSHAVPMSFSGHNPTSFSAIYGGSGVPTASGITVGIITQGSLTNVLSDFSQFLSNNSLGTVQTQVINTNGTGSDTSGDGEWDLDSQDIVGMAGGQVGKIIFYNIPSLSNADLTADFNKVVSDNLAKIINVSLGECETSAEQDGSAAQNNQIFEQAVAQGQTFSVSTGDSGADECGDGGTTPSSPASSPYVIAVAGTKLDTSGNTWNNETVWNELANGEGATGGSESTFQPRPDWQTLWSGQYRGVADVAFDGDPETGSLVIVDGSQQQIGGTSLAAPLFAGLWARMLAANGTGLGFAGPHLYQLPASDFHDVTSGNNDGETAAAGYDLASGRGSIIMSQAVNDLAGGTGGTNQPPTAGFSDSVNNLTVSFSDSSSDSDGSIASWSWDFGDGASSTQQNPAHSYTSAGSYTVTLTVTDNDSATDSISHSVTVSTAPPANQPPQAAFTFSTSDLTASFSDGSSDSDGTIASWSWDFGDGASSTQQNPSHTYANAGTHSVSLTVTDNDSATDSVSHSVTVTSGAPPPSGTPSASVSPGSLSFSVAANDSDSQALTIGNNGDANLTFSIAEGPASDSVPTSYRTARARKASGATTLAGTALVRAGSGSSVHGLAQAFDAATMISQMSDNSPGTQGVACGANDGTSTSDNSWWRRFDFSEYPAVGAAAQITGVTVSSGSGSAANVPITVNLYTINHSVTADTIPTAQLTLIGSGTATIDSGLVSVTVPVDATVANTAGKDLVVEYHTDGTTSGKFEPGANSSAETHPSFISSSACSIAEPETGADIGFPDFHLTMVVDLAGSSTPVACQNPQDIPWLGESPDSGSVAQGASTPVSVTANANGMVAGDYSANVCVSTNDPAQPVIAVPVSLTVTPATCALRALDDLFHAGFDGSSASLQDCGPPPPGDIVTSGSLDWNVSQTYAGSSIDLVLGTDYPYDPNYVDDVNFYASGNALYTYWFGDQVNATVGGVIDGSGNVAVLGSGDVIGPNSSINSSSGEMLDWEQSGTTTGYVGIAFYNEDTGAVDYGYIHLQTNGWYGFPATILDYGYNQVGDPIMIP